MWNIKNNIANELIYLKKKNKTDSQPSEENKLAVIKGKVCVWRAVN